MATDTSPRRTRTLTHDDSLDSLKTRIEVHRDGECEHEQYPWIRKDRATRRLPNRSREMTFVSLHHHSTFSYLDGYQLPEAHVRRATELGMRGLAMTEHGNVSSHVRLEKAAQKAGVKPIFGVELYTGKIGEEATQRKNHLTVLASTPRGYNNLLRLVSRTYAEGYYYEPTADWSMLRDHRDGLVVLSGCQGSALFTSLVGGKLVAPKDASYERGKALARRFKANFNGNYYLEVQAFPELAETRRANALIADLSEELHIPLVATFDCHYTMPTEKELQQVLHAVRSGKHTVEEQARDWGYAANLCPPMNDASVVRKLQATGLTKKQAVQAVLSTEEIYDRCNVELPILPMVRFPLPDKFSTPVEYWRHLLEEGWRYRRCDRLPRGEQRRYRERLERECEVIEDKDFVDYFLVVGDAIRWAKDHGDKGRGIAVGPARGSSAGSLACWLLRITEVNPMLYEDLVFERFIDPSRQDLPDIDIDFDSETRYQVREYLAGIYGDECVSNIGTFTGYKAKNSLDDVARVYKIPKFEVDQVKNVLIERSSGDLRASATIEDTVLTFDTARGVFERHPNLGIAMELEGNYRGFGVHAAGIVVSTGPITDVCAVYERKTDEGVQQVVSMDKYDAEKQGLLKLDFLALSNMTMLNNCRLEMGWKLDDLYNIPLDDERTLAGFRVNDCLGVFQFEGRAMRYICGALVPTSFKECADVNALARPGPLHNGAANEYIDIKAGNKKPDLIHPSLEKITANTQYQIVYQEQILRILGEIFNFDWTHRAEVRRIISRKIGEQAFNRKWELALEGARELHPDMGDELAAKIWGMCITAGSYAFCLTGDAVIQTGGANRHHDGRYTLKELWEAYNSDTSLGAKLRYGQNGKRIKIQSLSAEDCRIRPAEFLSIKRSDVPQIVYDVTLENGMTFAGTLPHRVLTDRGYKELGELQPGDEVICQDPTYRYSQPSAKREQPMRTTYEGQGFQSGEGNISWIDGRTELASVAKAAVLERAKGVCEHAGTNGACHGREEYAHILTLDDFNGDYARYHKPSNMMYLCNHHHKKFDYGMGIRRRRDSKGRPTTISSVVNVSARLETEWVYELEMLDHEHNFVANGVVHHNNAAHAYSYTMIGFHTMWFKQHHPELFYTEMFKIRGGRASVAHRTRAAEQGKGDKLAMLIRDAVRGNPLCDRPSVDVVPPNVRRSGRTWRRGVGKVYAGFTQVPGIGEVTATSIIEWRKAEGEHNPKLHHVDWNRLIEVKGIGHKTIKNIVAFGESDDPFHALWLDKAIAHVKQEIREKKLGKDVPRPVTVSIDLPYHRSKDIPVIWLGAIQMRNERDLFEFNRAKTGIELKPEEVKDPHLSKWLVCIGDDETDQLSLRIDRYRYPKFREALWSMRLGHDLMLCRGVKKGYTATRQIDVSDLWIIDPFAD